MPDTITCPHCRRQLEISDQHLGREVRCPECRATFTPGAGTEITAAPPRFAPPPAAIQPGLPPPAVHPAAVVADDDDLADQVALRSGFRPGRGLATATKVLIGIVLALELAGLASNSMQYGLAGRIIAGQALDPVEIDNNDFRQMMIGIAHFIAYVAAGIVFLVWFSRAHANLGPLGARDLTYTSGWAAGYWFVPFLNLVRPVQVAQEIWRNSDPDEAVGSNSALIGFWWMMWILASISSNIAMRMSWDARTPEALRSATAAQIFADIASIIAAVLVIGVVSAIDARQTARADAMRDWRDFRE